LRSLCFEETYPSARLIRQRKCRRSGYWRLASTFK
jgi:hypothetical protein